MENIQIERQNNGIVRILKGLIFSFAVTLVSIFIFSIILTYTNLSESVIPLVIMVLTFRSILIGTILVVRKIKKNGMINGVIVGGTYVVLLYLISSIVNTGFTLNIYTIIMIIGGHSYEDEL